mmetsp:Transcript_30607/g.44733  ORF Transcript_30607/g.44733 Transcript_30607/m.44733 type:complete len:91 (+) Transcript_30607:222-494(+)
MSFDTCILKARERLNEGEKRETPQICNSDERIQMMGSGQCLPCVSFEEEDGDTSFVASLPFVSGGLGVLEDRRALCMTEVKPSWVACTAP